MTPLRFVLMPFGRAVTKIRKPWEPKATARNLSLIRAAREARGTAPAWATKMEEELLKRA
jgi:hypothetical protein